MAGFSQGGGVGLALANWMIEGDPGHDVWGMDVARYGDWATLALHQRQGARELLGRRFRIRFPNEELPAARPLRTSPIYDRLSATNAVFGESLRPRIPAVVRAEAGTEPVENITFRRSNAHSRMSARNAARCAPASA